MIAIYLLYVCFFTQEPFSYDWTARLKEAVSKSYHIDFDRLKISSCAK